MSFYEYPLFVDILLIAMYVLLFATVALAVWSMVNSIRQHGTEKDESKATRYISICVVVLLILTLGISWFSADSTPLNINGKAFEDRTWLCISDMLINSSIAMILIAAACVIVSMAAPGRRK